MNIRDVIHRELARRARMREIILGTYEVGVDATFVVRRKAVVALVGRELGVAANNSLTRVVREVVLSMGPRTIKPGNKRLFCGMRQRGVSEDEALAQSRRERATAPQG